MKPVGGVDPKYVSRILEMLRFYSGTFVRLSLANLKDVGHIATDLISSILNYRVAALAVEGDDKRPELLACRGLSDEEAAAWAAGDSFVDYLWREIDSPSIVRREELAEDVSVSAKMSGIDGVFLAVPLSAGPDHREGRIGVALAAIPQQECLPDLDIVGLEIIAGFIAGAIITCRARKDLAEANQRLHSDIAERKRVEDRLGASEERYRLLFNNVSDAVFVHEFLSEDGIPGRFIEVNDRACNYLGYSREELLQMRVFQIDDPETLKNVDAILKRLIAEGRARWEGVHVSKDRRRIPVEITNQMFSLDGRQTILSTVRDITERKTAEKELMRAYEELTVRNEILQIFLSKKDEEMYHEVLKVILRVTSSPYGVFGYIDSFGNYVCPTFTREIWSQCRMAQKDLIFPREQWGGIWGKALKEKMTVCINQPLPVPDGHIPITRALDVPIVYRDKAVGNVLVANKEADFDEKDRRLLETIVKQIAPVLSVRLAGELLEEQLRQSQKMEAIGRLAGGVAHEFNNILMVIMGYSSFLQTQLYGDESAITAVRQISLAADRAASLTKGLLALSRKQPITPEPLRLNRVIDETVRILSKIIGEHIELRTFLSADDPVIIADRHQIEQVLINLSTNARDAMSGTGVLTISTGLDTFDSDSLVLKGYDMEPGRYVFLSVCDTGVGIRESDRKNIFEPFFTTKETGKGTGLGLSIVHGIIRQNRGYIHIDSHPGKGSAFHIYFPETDISAPSEVSETVRPPKGGNETILLAEDQAEVRELLRRILSLSGYSIVAAVDGEDAVRKYLENREAVKLLILDIVMPNKNGNEAYYEIKRISPDIKVIFLSGHTQDLAAIQRIFDEGLELIPKPVLPHELLQKVRQTLDSKTPGS